MSCNQNAAEDGTQRETAICLPPVLTPDPDVSLERGVMWGPAAPTHLGPARPCPGAAAGAHPRRPRWSCCGHEARAPFQSTYSLNVYRLAVLAGLSTAHVFYTFFFFFNIFYKKKRFYTSNIYMDFYNHSM